MSSIETKKTITRALTTTILDRLVNSNKAVVIYGARQVGKTTLANNIINQLNLRTLSINGDISPTREILSSLDLKKISDLVAGYQLIFIDEAQRIPEIGLALKIIKDNFPSLKVLVTGSSSLDLASKISEPLTGRAWSYHLYPISYCELANHFNKVELNLMLEERLIYGSYPEIFSLVGHEIKREYLLNLSNAYLYKDLLDFGEIKNSAVVRDLLKLIAFQVGSQVSLSEISTALGVSKETVSMYIDLLEKAFVLFRLKGFSRNLRKEVVKMDKIYFYDLGVRNIIIDNLKPLNDRNDIGALWENFLIVERIKLMAYTKGAVNSYFWRTYTGAELDYVEDYDGKLYGYEFKYGRKLKRYPKTWLETYRNAEYFEVDKNNYLDFILTPLSSLQSYPDFSNL